MTAQDHGAVQPNPIAQDRLIVALDTPNLSAATALLHRLDESILWYKVGLELYLAEGAAIVHLLRERGKRVFLDLKLHDIPNTVAAAVRVAARSGADLLTVHASGGPAMLRAAVAAAAESSDSLRLLAVTILTSMEAEELAAVGVPLPPGEQVLLLGRMALRTGVAGLVCSPLEAAALRREHGSAPLLVVPGIRGAGDLQGDQQRFATAAEAIRNGASMLVVGRPITRSADPAASATALLTSIDDCLREMRSLEEQ